MYIQIQDVENPCGIVAQKSHFLT